MESGKEYSNKMKHVSMTAFGDPTVLTYKESDIPVLI